MGEGDLEAPGTSSPGGDVGATDGAAQARAGCTGLGLVDGPHGSMLQTLAHADELGIKISAAFSEPICLADDVTVAGTTHVRGIDGIACELTEGDRLAFVRDPDNRYDSNAIEVHAPGGARMGFVPCDLNPIPARLMDAGKLLYGEVTGVELRHTWWRIQMRVLMED